MDTSEAIFKRPNDIVTVPRLSLKQLQDEQFEIALLEKSSSVSMPVALILVLQTSPSTICRIFTLYLYLASRYLCSLLS